MSSIGTPSLPSHATEIVACVMSCLRSKGLERTQEYFDGMEHLLSGLPFFYHELNELNEFSMQNIMIMMHLRCNALGFLALASVSLRHRATAFTKAIAD